MISSFFPEARSATTHPVTSDLDSIEPEWDAGWLGRPRRVLPGVSDLVVEIGRSDTTAVVFQGGEVYPQGVLLQLVIYVRERQEEAQRQLFKALNLHHGRGQFDLSLPPGGLRWGMEFADGARVTSMDDTPYNEVPDGIAHDGWEPDHPVMDGVGMPVHGWGCWQRGIWLWPLPPLPTMRLVCAWPDRGIVETSVEVSTEGLHAAADRARPVW
ncbi:hypothetical protein SAMN06264364_11154 [Quadrisphaera granulorum]|uniref:Uncharacterized protein n=1 Tax=Quadrisphaera granulorum TaxID=317664 RepID=A0A316A6Z6_9ACTN|nr:hypothetical protein [Quadrisphaera granulorum]PWJ53651.1 hypothetical protein BXY45_11154 [Quadrisphaera granulorum]SZE96695.1 hypothetical protein SAMN06264364_11154 [Quadrisphaera granulorum]